VTGIVSSEGAEPKLFGSIIAGVDNPIQINSTTWKVLMTVYNVLYIAADNTPSCDNQSCGKHSFWIYSLYIIHSWNAKNQKYSMVWCTVSCL